VVHVHSSLLPKQASHDLADTLIAKKNQKNAFCNEKTASEQRREQKWEWWVPVGFKLHATHGMSVLRLALLCRRSIPTDPRPVCCSYRSASPPNSCVSSQGDVTHQRQTPNYHGGALRRSLLSGGPELLLGARIANVWISSELLYTLLVSCF
jgi:hypothetical protein